MTLTEFRSDSGRVYEVTITGLLGVILTGFNESMTLQDFRSASDRSLGVYDSDRILGVTLTGFYE